jgi:PAS domain S-box-containing protein
MRWWPRSIRRQVLLSLVLLQVLSIAVFAVVSARLEKQNTRERAHRRLTNQAVELAFQARQALELNRIRAIGLSVNMAGTSPSVQRAMITDAGGNMLYLSGGEADEHQLEERERAEIPAAKGAPHVFSPAKGRLESVAPIYLETDLRGFAWVEADPKWDDEQIASVVRGIMTFGALWIGVSILLALWVSRSIAKPLAVLHRGTRALISLPESKDIFPLPVTSRNEFGDLIRAFNSMVASIQEQRAGLNDTLALLDSMLANAPIGLAFFDRHQHFVRVNQIFANMSELPVSRHLGRRPVELFPKEFAQTLSDALQEVFETESPVEELELSGMTRKNEPFLWLVSVYPVQTALHQVRWVGIIVRDVSERARAEEALRRTEKLAATGRLAASIAHEINNPLEAVTNLLFLLKQFSNLEGPALQYVTMAEHEVRRISEIAQQTLRFYRQSTLPQRTDLGQVIESVLDLYKGRTGTLNLQVNRKYDPEAMLFCFEGEIRQVIANLVGNAIDASRAGGKLRVRTRRSRLWSAQEKTGVRVTVADTGSGMPAEVRQRIFEPFFTTKDATGTGLGLWVSLEIIEKHKGRVAVRSRPENGGGASGTVFHLFFPDQDPPVETLEIAAG